MCNNLFRLKAEVLEYSIYPQLPSFCGVAACCCALSSILGIKISELSLHEKYQIGLYTKLQATVDCPPEEFARRPRIGKGFSNWDVIRLCNAVLLDEGREPFATILCGQDLAREMDSPEVVERLFAWLQRPSRQAIVHLVNHYALLAGTFQPAPTFAWFLLLADSSTRSGPVRSFSLADLVALANQDERYGLVIVADEPIPPGLFVEWTSAMVPPEVSQRQRFARIEKIR